MTAYGFSSPLIYETQLLSGGDERLVRWRGAAVATRMIPSQATLSFLSDAGAGESPLHTPQEEEIECTNRQSLEVHSEGCASLLAPTFPYGRTIKRCHSFVVAIVVTCPSLLLFFNTR
jgi:hypothetical protein